jgi:Carboxypeptidase regulatory-like domain
MKSRKLSIAAFIFAIVFILNAADKVQAVELITNGGFETGSFAPWVSGQAGCTEYSGYVVPQVTASMNPLGLGYGGTTTPFAGTRFAWNGWACGPNLAVGTYYSPTGAGNYTLYQDVTVPAGTSLTLKFSERFYKQLNFWAAGDWRNLRSEQHKVEIRNTSNVVLATPYSMTAPASSITDIPWTSQTINLGTAYAGQTIRLAFVWVISTGYAGPGNIGLDAVSLDAVVPSAADGSVTGRVSLPSGRGISRASLRITDSQTGEVKIAMTNPFGYFRFTELETGHFYILNVSSKRYVFQPDTQSFQVNDNLEGINFIGSPPEER